MIVVAIIGVLAALAIYGVNRYLASAKTAEAKNTVGAISRGAVSAYERETTDSEMLAEGADSTAASHAICDTAIPVPLGATPPTGRKYQPNSVTGFDYNTGTATGGWQCIKHNMTEASYYQYHYINGSVLPGSANTIPCAADTCFAAGAVGDLDGDGEFSVFERLGQVNTTTQTIRTATQLYVQAGARVTAERLQRQTVDPAGRAVCRLWRWSFSTYRRCGERASPTRCPGSTKWHSLTAHTNVPPMARPRTAAEIAAAIAIGGSLLAIAVPSFIENLAYSKLSEPIDGLDRLVTNAVSYAADRPQNITFPPSAPLTPAEVPRGAPQTDPPNVWKHLTWEIAEV